jgi:hypothetical protein
MRRAATGFPWALAWHEARTIDVMKLMHLALVASGLGLFAVGCSDAPADDVPVEMTTTRVASTLERKLPSPIAVPTDTGIGQPIEAFIEARTTALTLTAQQPLLKLSVNGKRCLVQRFDDANGKQAMQRETCESDVLRAGTLVFTAAGVSGRIEHFADEGAKPYEAFDDDKDGKVDRVIESAEHIEAPVALKDFAPDVTIAKEGKIASRTREDRDHDGKFDVESITATTSFQLTEPKAP